VTVGWQVKHANQVEILFIFLLTLLNGVFSMSEIAVVSSRKVKLQNAAKRGSKSAQRALELFNAPNQFLSTVQIGITLIGILLGIFGGESLTGQLQSALTQIEILRPYSRPLAVGGVLLLITFMSLVVGELLPKRIGLTNPEAIARTVALPMQILSKMTAPFVWLLTNTTELLLKILQIKPSTDSKVTEEEIKAIIQEGTESGEVQEIEQEIMQRVFHLGDRRVSSLMTHRSQVVGFDVEDTLVDILQKIKSEPHAVYPLFDGAKDYPVGIIVLKELFLYQIENQHIDLRKIAQNAQYIPENSSAYQMLELFQNSKIHYGVVTDEYGQMQGLITLHDLVDALVGDVQDTVYDDETSIFKREDGSFIADGQLTFYDFLQYFERSDLYDEDIPFNTLGGLVLNELGRLPRTGEQIKWQGFSIEVLDMDGARIDKLLLKV
jgi:putative hemolysin